MFSGKRCGDVSAFKEFRGVLEPTGSVTNRGF
jgi:hypothetical protein